jgi:hypothetical protein
MALVLATSVKARLVPPVLRPSPADPPSASLVEEEREDADTRGEGGASSSITQLLLHRPLAIGSRAWREWRRRGGDGEEDGRAVGKNTDDGSEGADNRGPHLASPRRHRAKGRCGEMAPGGPTSLDPPEVAAAREGGGGEPTLDAPRVARSGPGEEEGGRRRRERRRRGACSRRQGRRSSTLRPRRERTKLPFPLLRRARRGGRALSVEHRDLRRVQGAPLPSGGVRRRVAAPFAGEGDGGEHAVAAWGRVLLAGSTTARLLVKSRRGRG